MWNFPNALEITVHFGYKFSFFPTNHQPSTGKQGKICMIINNKDIKARDHFSPQADSSVMKL